MTDKVDEAQAATDGMRSSILTDGAAKQLTPRAGGVPNAEAASEDVAAKLAFDRIVFLSDAIFAIAMTVLILDLVREYQQLNLPACGVYCHLREVGGLIVGYSVTFGVLGMIWAAHHHIFRSIARHDFRLIVCNLVHLAFTVATPFTAFVWGSSLSGLTDPTRVEELREAATLYAANLGLLGLSLCVLWFYASHGNRLTYTQRVEERGRYYSARLWTPTLLFLACIPVAQWRPVWADVLLVLTWFTSVFFLRRILVWTHWFPYLRSSAVRDTRSVEEAA